MNKERRSSLRDVIGQIEHIMNILAEINDDEQEYIYNMPENLQSGERYEKATEAQDNLESALDSLQEACEYIESAME